MEDMRAVIANFIISILTLAFAVVVVSLIYKYLKGENEVAIKKGAAIAAEKVFYMNADKIEKRIGKRLDEEVDLRRLGVRRIDSAILKFEDMYKSFVEHADVRRMEIAIAMKELQNKIDEISNMPEE